MQVSRFGDSCLAVVEGRVGLGDRRSSSEYRQPSACVRASHNSEVTTTSGLCPLNVMARISLQEGLFRALGLKG